MELKELHTLGLTNGEIKVYSAVLTTGNSSINQIHEKTGLERRGIYDIINKLIEKGLISYTEERKKKTYQTIPINKLKTQIQEKQEELNSLKHKLPEIEKTFLSAKPKTRFEIFRGKEGIKTIFEDMLKQKNIYIIGGGFYLVKELPHFWPQYNERRIKAKCKWHNLVINELKNKIPETKLVNYKILPEEFSGNSIAIIIYENKVVQLSWLEEKFAILIENKQIAENYKKYHKYLWEKVAEK
jgi:HTH-type transcriptional regulator, sugar sensing transcriptional regulator